MESVTVSTKYASSIRIKNKTFILFLRSVKVLEVYGAGIQPDIPLKIGIDNDKEAMLFKYDESEVWEKIKSYKKDLRKMKKDKNKKKSAWHFRKLDYIMSSDKIN